ncbi:MAG: peptidyl-prolyl cis-trans isomerase [Candidatus Thiodiazotropha sp. (ex Ustalcina ferruginea)]|nr:peptidyl-prolyl cis-trans isomerase [Candidatus Thiodiazotropha sp. (ex Ustalcina ferruginea)]
MLHRYHYFGMIVSLSCLVLISACSRDQVTSEKPIQTQQESLNKETESVALAYVNGSPITEDDTRHAMQKLFTDPIPQVGREQVKQRILESLISSRAIFILARDELDAEELAQLEAKVKAYREELFVQSYLTRHAVPEPVSGEMVTAYYQDHPEAFGGGVTKRFEMIQTYRSVTEQERKALIGKLSELSNVDDWSHWLEGHKSLPINLRQLTARVEILDQPLQALVSAAGIGETSPLHIDDVITVIRVNTVDLHPPKPLAEVSAEIRKRLAPIKMRAAIKLLAEDALQKVSVEIVVDKPDNSG